MSAESVRVGVDLLDLLLGVDLVADELQAGGELGDVEAHGGAAGQIEAKVFIEAVDKRLTPFYRSLDEALVEAEVGDGGKGVMLCKVCTCLADNSSVFLRG